MRVVAAPLSRWRPILFGLAGRVGRLLAGTRGGVVFLLAPGLVVCSTCGCGGDDERRDPSLGPPAPVPLETASVTSTSVSLRWPASDAVDFEAYEIHRTNLGRSSVPTGAASSSPAAWSPSSSAGSTGSRSGSPFRAATISRADSTSWTDAELVPHGLYQYALRVRDRDGELSDVTSVQVSTPGLAEPHLGFRPRRAVIRSGDTLQVAVWSEGVPGLAGFAGTFSLDAGGSVAGSGTAGDFPGERLVFLFRPEGELVHLGLAGRDTAGIGWGDLARFDLAGDRPRIWQFEWAARPRLEGEDGQPLPGGEITVLGARIEVQPEEGP